ncbi:MAG: RNA polymerase sigma factor [Candidatus Komeilibacteria bacterium]
MKDKQQVDAGLLVKINRLDPAAFSEAYDIFSEKIYRFFYWRTSSQEITEDLTSQTFLKVWEYIRQGKKIEHWSSFVYRVAHNLLVDYYTAGVEKKEIELIENISDLDNSRDKLNDLIDYDLNRQELINYIDQLPKDYREIILWRYMEDLSFKEISKITGKNTNTLYVSLHRAQAKLKQLYENT